MPRGRRSSSRSSNRNKRNRSSSESSRILRPRLLSQPSQADNNNDDSNPMNNEEKKDHEQSSMDIDEKKVIPPNNNQPLRQSRRGRPVITTNNTDNNNDIIDVEDYEDKQLPLDQSSSMTMSSIPPEALKWMVAEYQRMKNQTNHPPSTINSLSLAPPPNESIVSSSSSLNQSAKRSRLFPSTPFSADASESISSHSSNSTKIQAEYIKQATKILATKTVPLWTEPTRDHPSVVPYLISVEHVMTKYEEVLPKDQWYRIIEIDKQKVDTPAAERLMREVLYKKPSWSQLKQLMVAAFDRKDYMQILEEKLHSLRQGSSTVSQYNNAFDSIMSQLNYEYDPKLITTYLQGLNKNMQLEYRKRRAKLEADNYINNSNSGADFNDLRHVMLYCERLSYEFEQIDPHSSSASLSHKSVNNNHNRSSFNKYDRNINPPFPNAKYCKTHGWCRHSSQQCYGTSTSSINYNNNKINNNNSNSSINSSSSKPSPICHICRGPHYANQCPKRSNNKAPAIPAIIPTSSAPILASAPGTSSSSNGPWPPRAVKQINTQIRQLMAQKKKIRQNSQSAKNDPTINDH